jgi:hypothetical protein
MSPGVEEEGARISFVPFKLSRKREIDVHQQNKKLLERPREARLVTLAL